MRNGERSIENDNTWSISCFNINSIYGVIFMSDTHSWCHGPYCHEKKTQDRVRGVKGFKVLRTRKIALDCEWRRTSKWGHFCSQRCLDDYEHKHLAQFVALGPRLEPLETPINVEQRKVNDRRYNWETREHEDYVRTEKTITSIDNANR